MQEIINKLINKEHLTKVEAGDLLGGIMNGELSPVRTAMVLTALRMKGETVEEIAGFIEVLRSNMVKIKVFGGVDVCGTGGDSLGTFNISTAVSFVLASAGVRVVKHGNRAASSLCGCADVLEEMGMKIDLSPEQAEKVFKKTGMVFLFAPLYHPAYKPVAIVRKELKIPTVFNFLGPFINPASVKRQLIGVSNREMAAKLAEVAEKFNYTHLIIVSSQDGLDEVSIFAPTTIFEVRGRTTRKYKFNPKKYGMGGKFEQIVGGDASVNARILMDIFAGKRGERRDIVVLNSAFGFLVADKVKSVEEGISIAEEMIDSGRVARKVEEVVEETNKYQKSNIPPSLKLWRAGKDQSYN
ncbi:anthranilate phosphoribosyltransferase [Patescibacteria group bacterium]|nr:anthranilate phosphoribosyltransferase [Patescibacteria group bacterium]MBU4098887.1 anthranilate phosphoribosyltransferase [Patescibacteria group bacterium]